MTRPKFFVHDQKRIVEISLASIGDAHVLERLPDPETCRDRKTAIAHYEAPPRPTASGDMLKYLTDCVQPERFSIRRFERARIILFGKTFHVWLEEEPAK